uniref:Uncharacterized protein n=1 Tax=Triticum urartu TaxID=4572 RepID=A0A8R7PXQ0_TRIUA
MCISITCDALLFIDYQWVQLYIVQHILANVAKTT